MCRWGVINDEYDWDDDDSSDYSDEDCEDDAFEESEVPGETHTTARRGSRHASCSDSNSAQTFSCLNTTPWSMPCACAARVAVDLDPAVGQAEQLTAQIKNSQALPNLSVCCVGYL